jgi:pilus assembly protein CpaF
LGAVPPRERIITVEETFELQPATQRDVVAMQCRPASLEGTGEIPLRRLIKEALRMRPDRLIVGEVRQAETLDMLLALNSGLPGMATVHANSAREALLKICTLPLLAGENISSRFILPTVAMSIDLVVHIQLDADGRRRVSEIVGVPGRMEADVIETATLFVRRNDRLIRTEGFPPHADRYARAGIDLQALLHGGWR